MFLEREGDKVEIDFYIYPTEIRNAEYQNI